MQKRLNLKTSGILMALVVVVFAALFWIRKTEEIKPGEAYQTLPALKAELKNATVDLSKKPVIDLSAYQPYKEVDYAVLSKQISGAVVRVQDGTKATASVYINKDGSDPAFEYHMTGLQAQGIPVAVYAYANGDSIAEMQKEADSFYERAKAYQPKFWWVDVEAVSMKDMNAGVEAFRAELKKMGAKNIGIYSRDNFLSENSIDTSKFDAVWLAFYGAANDGSYTAVATTRSYQMQQYTDKGKLDGYNASLDMDRILSVENYRKIFLDKK